MKKIVKSLKRGFLIRKIRKIGSKRLSRRLQMVSLALFLNIFHLAIAGAPSEPVAPTQEYLTGITSLTALTPLEKNHKSVKVTITAYSSTKDQTDETPFITAANTKARDGVIAANFLPLHTRVIIPEIFGGKIFVVEDRMNERYDNTKIIDIWFAERNTAKNFGLRKATIQIL